MTGVGENQKNGTTESCAGCGGSRNVKPCKACNGSMHVPVLRIVRGTVSRDSAGWWFISLTVNVVRQIRVEPTARQKAGGTIGVDFGVRDLATLSNGDIIRNPRFLAGALRRLARAQRVMARRRNGSPKYALAAARLGRMHARVRHLREDHLQKITTWLVRNHERIGMEGFNVQATAHYGDPDVPRSVRRARNQALADAAIGRGRWMIAHKGGWDGCKVVVTGPHEKTGRTCSRCGQVRITPVPPAKDMFECGNCGFRGSRRVNTAAVAAQYARDGITTTAPSSEDVAKNGRGEDVSRTAVRRRTQSSGKRQASRRPPGGRPGTLGG
jgi:putative transposase